MVDDLERDDAALREHKEILNRWNPSVSIQGRVDHLERQLRDALERLFYAARARDRLRRKLSLAEAFIDDVEAGGDNPSELMLRAGEVKREMREVDGE